MSGFERLAILDNGLMHPFGHHINYSQGVVRIAEKNHIGVVGVFAFAHYRESLNDSFQPVPYFRSWLYSATSDASVHATEEDTRQLLPKLPAGTTLFWPNAKLAELLAMQRLAESGSLSGYKLRILIRYSDLFADENVSERLLAIVSKLDGMAEDIWFYSDTSTIVQRLRSATQRVLVIGFPQRIPFSSLTFAGVYDYGYFGQVEVRKGFHSFVNALRIGGQIDFKPKCFVQCPNLEKATLATLKADPTLSNVVFHDSHLSEEAFYQRLSDTRTVLNTYDPAAYALGSSGILLEALALRRQVVTTSYPWSQELLGEDFVRMNAVPFNNPMKLLHSMITLSSADSVPMSLVTAWDAAWQRLDENLFIATLMRPSDNQV